MSSNSRGAAAAFSRRAKQDLERLLFPARPCRAGGAVNIPTDMLPGLDHGRYSYRDLRAAYLHRLQCLHPDKQRHHHHQQQHQQQQQQQERRHASGRDDNTDHDGRQEDVNTKSEFLQLQDAWRRYDDLAKMMRKVATDRDRGRCHKPRPQGYGTGLGDHDDDDDRKGVRVAKNNHEYDLDAGSDAADANFTMFGVGCSFADNEHEKALRCEIMDQAGRGWFSAGALSSNTSSSRSNVSNDPTLSSPDRLCNDSEEDEERHVDPSAQEVTVAYSCALSTTTMTIAIDSIIQEAGRGGHPSPSLVAHLLPPTHHLRRRSGRGDLDDLAKNSISPG